MRLTIQGKDGTIAIMHDAKTIQVIDNYIIVMDEKKKEYVFNTRQYKIKSVVERSTI